MSEFTGRIARIAAAAIIGAALVMIFGCRLEMVSPDEVNSERGGVDAKSITAFSFASLGVVATIDQDAKSISAIVPYGTDVTALVATFTTTGTNVMVGSTVQVSGLTANNFSSPVIYKVWAANGKTKKYTATVTVAPSASKAITAFSFAGLGLTAAIDEEAKSIAATVPYGTDLTALVATFTTTGASVTVGSPPVTQVSGQTPNDFRLPVHYIVIAGSDGSTADYTVTVTVGPAPSAKAITVFLFLSPVYAEATIDEAAKTIRIEMPYGTDLTALVASFLTTGDSVRVGETQQKSNETVNNFSTPVDYVVTAADGSTAIYRVTVAVGPQSSNKAITYFRFESPVFAEGIIDEVAKSILVDVPSDTDLTALVATFLTTGASVTVGSPPVTQVSGQTPNDFSLPVHYIVTAGSDGSTADYTVTVTTTLLIDCSFYPCPAGYVCGYDGYCVQHCFDGERNGDEGGVDCGGSCAAKCPAGSHCWLNYDCASGNCYYDVCQ